MTGLLTVRVSPVNRATAQRATAQPRNRATAQPRNRATAQPRNRATAQPRNRATAQPRKSAGNPFAVNRFLPSLPDFVQRFSRIHQSLRNFIGQWSDVVSIPVAG